MVTTQPDDLDRIARGLPVPWGSGGLGMTAQCPYCDLPYSSAPGRQCTRDHIIPKTMRLNFGRENVIACCRQCNLLKGSMTPDAMEMQATNLEAMAARLRTIASNVRLVMRDRGLLIAPGTNDAALRALAEREGA